MLTLTDTVDKPVDGSTDAVAVLADECGTRSDDESD